MSEYTLVHRTGGRQATATQREKKTGEKGGEKQDMGWEMGVSREGFA